MPNTRQDRSGKRGFTLIEMLVVIVIIAIMSSIMVPRYFDFAAKARFQESVQKVLTVFADARHKAIQSGSDCTVRYDSQSATLIVESEVAPPQEDQPVALQDPAETVASMPTAPVQLGENIQVSEFQVDNGLQGSQSQQSGGGRNMQIQFHEDGRADAAMISLVGSEGERAIVEVAPLTGYASIREGQQQ